MFKKIFIIAGILIVGIASFSLYYEPLKVDTTVVNKDEEQNVSTLKMVTEELQEKYVGFVVKTTSKNELVIQVEGNEEYFNSVKNDIESITKSTIESSPLKEYTVIVERLDLSFITEEDKSKNKEQLHLATTIMEGLNDFNVIEEMNTDYQKSITIHTSIKGSGKDAHKLAIEIEEKVNEILHSKELKSASDVDSYEIKVFNTNGKVVN